MTEKPPVRLKFKDSPSSTNVTTQPVPKSKAHAPMLGTEPVLVKCGHSIAFELYVKDPYREQRRAKAVARDCPPCRQERVKADTLAAKDRRTKKSATFAKSLKPRLPDGARFVAAFDATAVQWTGTLTVEGATFERQGSSLNKLLHKLDDAYRSTVVAVSQDSSAVAAP